MILLTAFPAYAVTLTGGGGGGVGSGDIATDEIWDTAGDIAYGTGANTAGKLAIGTAYQLLMTNAGATAPAWTSTLGATGTRFTKGWFTDLEVTNAIAGSVTGNAGTATALAANPMDCGALGLATAIDASGNLTCGYAIGTDVQAFDADLTTWAGVTPGTGVATALAVNVGSAGAPVLFDGALGTPSSGTVTNLTGTASININGTVGATTPAAGTFTSVTIAKSSGVAGDLGLYEANSTDTHAAGFRGPASITGDGAYRILFPNARAAAAGQVLAVTNAGESGTGTAADPYIQTGSWITPLVAGTATGGVILGDDSPDAEGELGYASTQLVFHDGTSARNVAKAGTLTNTKWCSTDGTVINCAEDAPAGSGDITAVGSCASGSCATIGNADTSGGYIDFLEDSDNGTNYVRLKAPDSTADATITLPDTTGTLAILGANTFTGNQTLDDGTGASPTLTFQDATNETAVFEKADAGFLTITTVAGDGVNIVTGNFKVGNGAPTKTQDGEDAYIEGMLEVDGVIYADGGITGATASDPYIKLDETDGTDWWIGVDDTGNSLEFRTNVAVGNTVRMELYESTGLLVTPPAAQTIEAGNTIAANACGTIKIITSAGDVTTNTTNTFTEPAATNAGCCMDVINTGANTITLDVNTNFVSAGAANVALGAGDTVRVCSTGASGKWYQIGATGNN